MELRSGMDRLFMRLDLDMPIHCLDSEFGELADVVIDPSRRRVTHLVVQPQDRHDHARLVPIEAADGGPGSGGISLASTAAEISKLEPIQRSAYLRRGESPSANAGWDVGIQEATALPEYGSLGPQDLGAGMTLDYDQHVAVSYHRVPKGFVEIRRASPVNSSDGHYLGHVVGFVVDDHEQITQLVLEHGHLWGKRTVAIPSGAIVRLETDEVVLSLSSDEVGKLKSLPDHRWRS